MSTAFATFVGVSKKRVGAATTADMVAMEWAVCGTDGGTARSGVVEVEDEVGDRKQN